MKNEKIQRMEQEFTNRRPINKWLKRSNTGQTMLKLLDAEINMNKTHLKIYVDTNDFKMMAKTASNLERMVGDYNEIYNNCYGL